MGLENGWMDGLLKLRTKKKRPTEFHDTGLKPTTNQGGETFRSDKSIF